MRFCVVLKFFILSHLQLAFAQKLVIENVNIIYDNICNVSIIDVLFKFPINNDTIVMWNRKQYKMYENKQPFNPIEENVFSLSIESICFYENNDSLKIAQNRLFNCSNSNKKLIKYKLKKESYIFMKYRIYSRLNYELTVDEGSHKNDININ
jgi:hypothetical protein